jgi:nucleoid-associated protein YgaU
MFSIANRKSQFANWERIPTMRKDVKLGFAIGGVLLSVLVVYVLVVSGGSSSAETPQPVSLAMTADKTPAAAPAAPAEQPQQQRRNRNQQRQNNEGASQASSQQPRPEQSRAEQPQPPAQQAKPATAPSQASEVVSNAKSDVWSALHGGMPALMTTTPTSRPAATPAPVAAEANLPTPPAGSSSNLVTPIMASTASPNTAAVTGNNAIPIRVSPTTRGSDAATASAGQGSISSNTPSGHSSNGVSASDGHSSSARTHVVQTGETYSSIAATVYGSSAFYPALVRANPTIDAKKLRPGMTINIPPESEVKGDAPASGSIASSAGSSSVTVSSAQPAKIDEKTEYRVESGDSLYKISSKLYGKIDRSDKIYDLNKALIGPDKAKLKPGMVLKLPEPPTVK